MAESIRKKERRRSTVTCPQCPELFTGRSQRKAETKWREHWVATHMVDDPIPEPDGFAFQSIWSE